MVFIIFLVLPFWPSVGSPFTQLLVPYVSLHTLMHIYLCMYVYMMQRLRVVLFESRAGSPPESKPIVGRVSGVVGGLACVLGSSMTSLGTILS